MNAATKADSPLEILMDKRLSECDEVARVSRSRSERMIRLRAAGAKPGDLRLAVAARARAQYHELAERLAKDGRWARAILKARGWDAIEFDFRDVSRPWRA